MLVLFLSHNYAAVQMQLSYWCMCMYVIILVQEYAVWLIASIHLVAAIKMPYNLSYLHGALCA